MQERLQKILSGAGVCSRRAAEKLIERGAVTVNGERAELGARADPARDVICVEGRRVGAHEALCTVMLNKPAGVVTTMADERGRRTAAQLVQDCPARVLPVGRLDQYSEGLLLLTNDGALLERLTHPRYHVDKTYEVTVRGARRGLSGLSKPMEIDGYTIRPAQVELLRERPAGTFVLHITIHEGRNRQIRKMCAACGLRVLRLRRIAVGSLRLDPALRPGMWRELTPAELASLTAQCGGTSR